MRCAPEIEQVEIEDEPHLEFIARHVEAWARGEIVDPLLVNIPPAHSKTILCVIMLTPWGTNFIALFDWLLWNTLVIEEARPRVYGWAQTAQEERSALHRFFNTDLSRG